METKKVITKNSYLSFQISKEIFAVSVNKVLEVQEMQNITEVPDTPAYIVGIINFRGEILPVVETRIKFNMPPKDREKYVIIVIETLINGKKTLLGAIADAVVDVMEVADTEILEAPALGSNYNPDYLKGMIKAENGFIMVLDIDKVLSLNETGCFPSPELIKDEIN